MNKFNEIEYYTEKITPYQLDDYLNRTGSAGWELVTILPAQKFIPGIDINTKIVPGASPGRYEIYFLLVYKRIKICLE